MNKWDVVGIIFCVLVITFILAVVFFGAANSISNGKIIDSQGEATCNSFGGKFIQGNWYKSDYCTKDSKVYFFKVLDGEVYLK